MRLNTFYTTRETKHRNVLAKFIYSYRLNIIYVFLFIKHLIVLFFLFSSDTWSHFVAHFN